MLAIIVVILFAGSAIIKYPDVLSSQVVLTGSTTSVVVVAHASGKLKELHVNDNHNVTAGSAVFTVVPNGTLPIIGKAMLPVARSGKVKQGQRVNIRLKNCPISPTCRGRRILLRKTFRYWNGWCCQ